MLCVQESAGVMKRYVRLFAVLLSTKVCAQTEHTTNVFISVYQSIGSRTSENTQINNVTVVWPFRVPYTYPTANLKLNKIVFHNRIFSIAPTVSTILIIRDKSSTSDNRTYGTFQGGVTIGIAPYHTYKAFIETGYAYKQLRFQNDIETGGWYIETGYALRKKPIYVGTNLQSELLTTNWDNTGFTQLGLSGVSSHQQYRWTVFVRYNLLKK